MNLHLWLQQGIEIINKVGEKMQEHCVEVLIEFLQFLLLQLCRFRHLVQLVELLVLHFLVHHLPIVVKFIDILRTETHEAPDVFFFHAITLGEQIVYS